jgi:PAS domain S-box-containing protein
MVVKQVSASYALDLGIHYLNIVVESLDPHMVEQLVDAPVRIGATSLGAALFILYKFGALPWGEVYTNWWLAPQRPPPNLPSRPGTQRSLRLRILTPTGDVLINRVLYLPDDLADSIETTLLLQAESNQPTDEEYASSIHQLRESYPTVRQFPACLIHDCPDQSDQMAGSIRQRDRWHQSLLNRAWSACAAMDAEGRTLYLTPNIYEMLGYSPVELHNAILGTNIHPDYREGLKRLHRQLLDQPGVAIPYETCYRHKDGSWHYFEGVATNLLDDPDIGCLLFTFYDITRRRQVENRLEQVLSVAQEGLWIVDREGTFLYVSPRMADMLGYQPDEMIGHSGLSFLDEASQAVAREILRQRAETEVAEPEPVQFAMIKKDGTTITVLCSCTVLHDLRGDYSGSLCMVTDITSLVTLFGSSSGALLDPFVRSDRSDQD